jgi:hypothetical protein
MVLAKVGGGKFVVKSHAGKNLSKPMSRAGAAHRLQQIEYFKHRDAAAAATSAPAPRSKPHKPKGKRRAKKH